jgi:lysophospholipase L1-like esterase
MTNASQRRRLARGALALLAAAAVTSCGDDSADILEPGAGGSMFASYVALGNSITAGYQSGGINDSTQRESYAYLLAQQAGAQFVYPSLLEPGCPPPISIFLDTLSTVGGATAPRCSFRTPAEVLTPLNSVAVPTAFAWDLTRQDTPTGTPNPLQTFVLGGLSQLRRALEARPTFVSVWIGNNDVLAAASTGVLFPIPGASPGLIPADTITKYIGAAVDTLVAAPTLQGGVLVGIVDTPNAPRFFPGNALLTATGEKTALTTQIETAVGKPVTVLPNCIGSAALVSSIIVERIKWYPAANGYPPIISCAPATIPGVPEQALLGNLFILSPEEQAAISGTVAAVNAFLASKAESVGFAYYDPNTGLAALKTAGLIPAVPNFTSATAPFGALISLDGVHPRLGAHVAVANALIGVINSEYSLSIPTISTSPPSAQ